MKLIALTGLPRSGKDTVAEHLVARHSFVRRAFATPLKAAAAILLGREVWEMEGQHGFDREAVLPEWGFTTRWFLQVFGTEAMRHQIRDDFWLVKMRNSLAGVERAVITDVRFPNEVELVHSLGGIVVEITRPGCVRSGHVSDKGVPADRTLANEGTVLDLHTHVDELVRAYGIA